MRQQIGVNLESRVAQLTYSAQDTFTAELGQGFVRASGAKPDVRRWLEREIETKVSKLSASAGVAV